MQILNVPFELCLLHNEKQVEAVAKKLQSLADQCLKKAGLPLNVLVEFSVDTWWCKSPNKWAEFLVAKSIERSYTLPV